MRCEHVRRLRDTDIRKFSLQVAEPERPIGFWSVTTELFVNDEKYALKQGDARRTAIAYLFKREKGTDATSAIERLR